MECAITPMSYLERTLLWLDLAVGSALKSGKGWKL